MTSSVKIIIIGGGIAGLTCAIAALQAGLEVQVYEKRTLEGMLSGPGGIFIQRNAIAVYQKLGLDREIYAGGGTITKGGFCDRQGQPLYLNSPQFIGQSDLGACLSRPALQTILYHRLPEGTVHTEKRCASFAQTADGVEVTFSDGSSARGDILVGADGLYSQVRSWLHPDTEAPPIYSGLRCWRGIFNGDNISFNRDYSWGELWGIGDRFGYFKLERNRWGFYAFNSVPIDVPLSPMGSRKDILNQLFSDYGNPIPQIVDAIAEDNIYEDNIYDRLPLPGSWGTDRVTLIGDAAHPVQPNIGQGGCIAIEDAYELVKFIRNTSQISQLSAALREFEQHRSPRVEKVFATARQIGTLGALNTPFSCGLRNWIYRLTPTWLGDLQFKWLFDYQP
ncbi:FAD-dependent oxidoreductase [Roseofilum casamattae]|uniref:FAD-dependent monooxygenase n=1 Tax=Roseofilum casamattae BLCC-M143 TaxID=3022442 RepID=A0ABT7BSX3_9CYAN|nr:FAD-dependent oxidoreductase [Roseofilum casamattae]MDJ1182292.1 FAD-dependent monooxygenase [Roseofilum casamattae BLCC-M143]